VELAVVKLDGSTDSRLSVADNVFSVDFKEPLVHQVVTAYLSGGRAGTSSQKNRSDVRGGGSKPWRQKGTGRARAGTIRSPLFRGGGRTFPSSNRSYAQKVNRKMYRSAVCSILSELARQDRLRVCDEIQIDEPKTARMAKILAQLGLAGRTLVVTGDYHPHVTLASRNLVNVAVLEAAELDPVSLVGSETVLFTTEALRKVEESLQ